MNQHPFEKRIKNTLERMDFHDVRVVVDSQGIATLSGSVADANERALVVALVRTTSGITGIANQIGLTQ